jgi:hypothetical protein
MLVPPAGRGARLRGSPIGFVGQRRLASHTGETGGAAGIRLRRGGRTKDGGEGRDRAPRRSRPAPGIG